MLKTLNHASLWAYTSAAVYLGVVGEAIAQTSTSDPSAPLDVLKTARDKAKNSNLTSDSIAAGGSKMGFVIMILFAVAGIGLAGVSGVKLYKASQDENTREDTGRSLAGVIIGGALTILGVIIGVITNYMTGTT